MKTRLAPALLACCLAPGALADATIYGSLRSNLEYSRIGDNQGQDLTRLRLVDNQSLLGFKGRDQLDNGLTAFWQVENRVRIGVNNTNDGFNSRDSFLGLKGAYGEFITGKFTDLTDQFMPDVANGLDHWNRVAASAYLFAIQDGIRLNNAAQYTSPSWQGLQAKLLYDFGAKTSSFNYQGYQALLSYRNDFLKLGALYKHNNDDYSNGNLSKPGAGYPEDDYKRYLIGGTVTPLTGLDISAVWSRSKTRFVPTFEFKTDSWAIGSTYVTGKHGFGLQYAKINDQILNKTQRADTGAYSIVAQYKYSLSKQTSAIASIGHTRNDKNAAFALPYGNPGTFNMQEVSAGTLTSGAKITTFSLGLRSDF